MNGGGSGASGSLYVRFADVATERGIGGLEKNPPTLKFWPVAAAYGGGGDDGGSSTLALLRGKARGLGGCM